MANQQENSSSIPDLARDIEICQKIKRQLIEELKNNNLFQGEQHIDLGELVKMKEKIEAIIKLEKKKQELMTEIQK
ncbi:MAG TPA: hypothetical protein VE912_23215 [Bacteroidales bacterium]|nr:hypothetical protein [Bacteroidales bacterium]